MLARTYALALSESLADASSSKGGAQVSALVKVLERKGHQKLLRSIVREYEKITARAAKRKTVSVTVAQKSDEHAAVKATKAHGAFAEKEVVVSVDANLVAGYRIEGSDVLFDGSGRRQLINLYRHMLS